jgi:hypothetical protein
MPNIKRPRLQSIRPYDEMQFKLLLQRNPASRARLLDGTEVMADIEWTPKYGVAMSKTSYVHLSVLGGAEGSIWMCDCEDMADARNLFAACHTQQPNHQEMRPSSVLHESQTCIHLRALRDLGDSNRQVIMERGPVSVVREDPLVLSLTIGPKERAIISTRASKKEFECRGCRYNKHACTHVTMLKDYITENRLWDEHPFSAYAPPSSEQRLVGEEEEMGMPSTMPKHTPVSSHRITLDHLCPAAQERVQGLRRHPSQCIPPKNGNCERCGASWGDTLTLVEGNATLYGQWKSFPVKVYGRVCGGGRCGAIKSYDGHDDGIFAYTTKSMFLHEVMFSYIHSFTSTRMPYTAYHSSLSRQYEMVRGAAGAGAEAQTGLGLCSKATLTKSIQAFMSLLDIDYTSCFQCPRCDEIAWRERVIICDGHVLGCSRDLTPRVRLPLREGHGTGLAAASLAYISGTKHAQTTRSLIQAFSKGEDVPKRKLIASAIKTGAEGLVEALRFIVEQDETTINLCKPFLEDVATTYPISCLIPHQLIVPGVLQNVLDRKGEMTMEDRQAFLQWPAFSRMTSTWQVIPPELQPMLRRMVELAMLPRMCTADIHRCTFDASIGPSSDEAMTVFPNHPRGRCLRHYDTRSGASDNTAEAFVCTKNAPKRNRKFTPGLFAMFCPHGICLGFKALTEFESVRTLFEILVERFPEMPGVIVYDNACALSKYALTREPLLFSNVRFLIDRLHQGNHVGCHGGFCMRKQNPRMPLGGGLTLNELNSQAAEQCNAKMELIAASARTMGMNNFVEYTKLFLAIINKDVLKKHASPQRI